MSTVRTFLTLVFSYDEEWTAMIPLSTMHEEQAVYELELLGIPGMPVRREAHLSYPLDAPLTPEQLRALQHLKERGAFVNFHVRDEISN